MDGGDALQMQRPLLGREEILCSLSFAVEPRKNVGHAGRSTLEVWKVCIFGKAWKWREDAPAKTSPAFMGCQFENPIAGALRMCY